jgi:hypothetical protein
VESGRSERHRRGLCLAVITRIAVRIRPDSDGWGDGQDSDHHRSTGDGF